MAIGEDLRIDRRFEFQILLGIDQEPHILYFGLIFQLKRGLVVAGFVFFKGYVEQFTKQSVACYANLKQGIAGLLKKRSQFVFVELEVRRASVSRLQAFPVQGGPSTTLIHLNFGGFLSSAAFFPMHNWNTQHLPSLICRDIAAVSVGLFLKIVTYFQLHFTLELGDQTRNIGEVTGLKQYQDCFFFFFR